MCVCVFQTKSGRPAARVLEGFVAEPAKDAIDAATTMLTTTPPADDASDAESPAVVDEVERAGGVAGDDDTQTAAVATPTRTPDHHNTPRFRSVRPGDGAVIATMNQLVGMVRSLQADNRQLRQLVQAVQANQRQMSEEQSVMRKLITTMSCSVRAVETAPTPEAPMATPNTLPDVGLSEEEVRRIFRRSNNPGLFAAHLTQRLFPELFTDAQHKHHYNFYSRGALNKQPLSPTRRDVVRKLTVQHYPEVVSEGAFKAQCVSKVNELLRRPVRKQLDIPLALATSDISFTALMNLTDL